MWEDLFPGKCPIEMWNIFDDQVFKLVERYIPKKIPRNKSSIPRDRKILMQKRSKLQKKLHSESDPNSLRIVQDIELTIFIVLESSETYYDFNFILCIMR